MLEGKPSGENEVVTMQAIKSILSTYESETSPRAEAPKPAPKVAAGPVGTRGLQHVQQVEAKVRAARFTSVPGGEDIPITRPVEARVAPDAPVQPTRVRTSDKAKSKPKASRKPRNIAVPKLKTPSFARVLRHITRRRLAAIACIAIVVMYPGTVVLSGLAAIICVIGAFLLFGADRVWATVSQGLARYQKRAPKRASKLMDRLDDFAVHWDNILDRFPEGSVDALYLPDFASYEIERQERESAMDQRLDRMHSQV